MGLLAAFLAAAAQGCAAAAIGAGVGAAGGIAYTERGAQGDVKGDVRAVNQRAQSALREMGIKITGTQMKEAGKEQELQGKSKDDKDVSVKMALAGQDSTRVEVVARKGALQWDKDYAKEVLNRIVQQG